MSSNKTKPQIVSVAKGITKFKSVPLFLPNTVTYDAETNTVAPIEHNMDDDSSIREELVLCDVGLKVLQSVKKNISCISCAGPYRTGKSLLASRFLNDSSTFAVGPTLEGCTRGIWISTSCIVNPADKTHTFILDAEGTGDPMQGNDVENARIALTCLLISSLFLFNNTGRPDRGSLQFLNYLETICQRIPNASRKSAFPAFLWVFRDFFLQLPTRPDSTEQYTLKEYMMERVLSPTANNSNSPRKSSNNDTTTTVKSLLDDFESFDVKGIGHPRRAQSELPFDAQEMSLLDQVEWNEFSETFRTEVNQVIGTSLDATKPFLLNGSKCKGKSFGVWCQTVLDLVNSDDVLPNIPDLQQQLLQSFANDAVTSGIASYCKNMQTYLDGCPALNDLEKTAAATTTTTLKGVAQEDELLAKSDQVLELLHQGLRANITAPDLLESSCKRLQETCAGNPSSHLKLLLEENTKRSTTACTVVARNLYGEFRTRVRKDATTMSREQFNAVVQKMQEWFAQRARGPAVSLLLETYFADQVEADVVFLEQTHVMQEKVKKAVRSKEKVDKQVEANKKQISSLQQNLQQSKEQHDDALKVLQDLKQQEMKQLTAQHEKTIQSTLLQQQAKEAASIKAMTDTMNAEMKKAETKRVADLEMKRRELEQLQTESEQRLSKEVAAREDRRVKQEAAHEEELQRLLSVADDKMKKELLAGEEKRKAEQFLLRKAMDKALAEAEDKLKSEVRLREERLSADEKRHQEELERVVKEMEKQKKEAIAALEWERLEEKKKHEKKVEELEQKCRFGCGIL